MKLSKQHFEFLADVMGPLVGWPSQLEEVADHLAKTNPRFNRAKFIHRATLQWELHYVAPEIDDEIPY